MVTTGYKNTNFLNFGKYVVTNMDDSYEAAEVVGLDVELCDHQKRVVKRVIDLEGEVHVDGKLVESTALMMSDPPGSGKTYSILGVICYKKIPDRRVLKYGRKYGVVEYKPRHLIPVNVVVVGIPTFDQWMDEATHCKKYRVMGIGSARAMSDLNDYWQREGTIPTDILIVKASVMTIGGCKWVSLDYLRHMTNNLTWARVFYDDYDSFAITLQTECLRALSTVFVSATQIKQPRYQSNQEFPPKCRLIDSYYDDVLKKYFNVRTCDWYLHYNMRIPEYKIKVYKYGAAHLAIAGILRSLTDDRAKELSEMLAGDAWQYAREEVGNKNVLAGYIVGLNREYDEVVTTTRNIQLTLNDQKTKHKSGVCNWSMSDLLLGPIIGDYDWIMVGKLEELNRDLSKRLGILQQTKIELKYHFHECADCGVCYVSSCCGSRVCKCAVCDCWTDGVNYDGMVVGTAVTEHRKSVKLDGLLAIIKGEERESTLSMVTFDSCIQGNEWIEPSSNRKVLVFTSYLESLHMISAELSEVPHKRLCGTSTNIKKVVNEFKNGDLSVLIVNSRTHCAGLNLENATDLVFYHKMIDKAVETQVAARAQRYGRKNSLTVHMLCYDFE